MSTTNDFLQLIIRTANNKHADLEIQIPSIQTVFDLKQQIQLNHPTKPTPKDQRLIFAGKLLVDATQLQEIFSKSTATSFMIHLVLDSDKNATTPKSPSPEKVQSFSINREQTPVYTQPSTATNHSSAYEQYLLQLNQYQQQLQQFIFNPNGFSSIENQVYLQYCHTHYQMYQNLHAYQRTVASSTSINASPTTTQTNTNTNASETTPPPAAAAAAAAAAANNNNNNNELEPENDLLGILNMIVELFVLCSIIYFYSTFSRFLLVFLFFALLYLHCRGYLSIQRRRRVQPNPAPAAPEQAAGNNEAAGGTDEEVENEANDNNQQTRPSEPPPNPFGDNQISTTRVFLTAVSTFFSSLIPERPQRT